jgi:hypothetical protein
MDGVGAHIKMLFKDLKFHNHFKILKWLPDPYHILAHLANLLANPENSLITVHLDGEEITLKFSDEFFMYDDTWLDYRNKALTDLTHLRRFYNKKFLKETLAFMRCSSENKEKIGRVFGVLIDFFERLDSDVKWTESNKPICMYFILNLLIMLIMNLSFKGSSINDVTVLGGGPRSVTCY